MSKKKLKQEVWYQLYGVSLLAFSLITIAHCGALGRSLLFLTRVFLGVFDIALPCLGVVVAVYLLIWQKWPTLWSDRYAGYTCLFSMILTFNHYLFWQKISQVGERRGILDTTWQLLFSERSSGEQLEVGSGMLGAAMYASMRFLFDDVGTIVILVAVGFIGLLLITGVSYGDILSWLRGVVPPLYTEKWQEHYKALRRKVGKESAATLNDEDEDQELKSQSFTAPVIHDFAECIEKEVSNDFKGEQPLGNMVSLPEIPQHDVYHLPSLKLLTVQKKVNLHKEDVADKAVVLAKTLKSFGVQVKVTDIHRGPAVTRYEVQPETGVKVSRIVGLADDLALALAAKDIRIEAPIPGKSVLGIEVPSLQVATVGLRELLEDDTFQRASSKLSISLGRSISGEPIIANLVKMPHLLVAGATGSGKSVCINSMIMSLLYKATPSELRLIMIDPKMVELSMYNGIPHLLAPVVTDPRKAALVLKKIVKEMEKRYEMFAKQGVRDIERFNEFNQQEKLPYIVVIVDELADLMLLAAQEVEDTICRLAQMARAAGIHLVIATQRPSVDIITGVIKANIPSRIAFSVSSQVDSRTILDMGGAEKLLGQGDMLFFPVGAAKPLRVQGAFVADNDVEAVIANICQQQTANYQEEMIPKASETLPLAHEQTDELYDQAVRLVLDNEIASVSFLQRKLRIGYARAARLIDLMEESAIIGGYSNGKPREILITLAEYEAKVEC
ncbi:MAG: hypothetical protein RLZ12_944 [Bacillota bacterium]|jgi:S-DNA-T family DNA segregation ATPase FtsK/SpoIIIE